MTLAELTLLAVKASIVFIVVSLGLKARLEDITYLFRRPGLLLRSLLAMNVIMPLFAVLLVTSFAFHRAVEIALVCLAVSPVPPILPKKELKAGGSTSYAIGLLIAAALLAILFVPATVEIHGRIVEADEHISLVAIGSVVLMTVLAPLAVGVVVRYVVPTFAERVAAPLSLLANLLLGLSALAILVGAWSAIVTLVGNGTLAVIAVFVLAGLAIGHLLGGPDPDQRTVLALSTATRHPGVALAIVGANFPGEKAALAAILLCLIWGTILSIPYVRWRRHRIQSGVADA
jgi:BASS family bile acid:Na+ symporter